jgi:hypothetical protein
VNIATRVLITAGFCTGTVGAIGFTEETPALAWILFGLGLGVVVVFGLLGKLTGGAEVAEHESHGQKQQFREMIGVIRDRVAEIDEQKDTLDEEEVRRRIDHLLANEYFDLTSRHEDLIALIGFQGYAKVWEGVATAERLLARAWSMATDGWADEGWRELPRAHAELDRAAAAMAEV